MKNPHTVRSRHKQDHNALTQQEIKDLTIKLGLVGTILEILALAADLLLSIIKRG